METMLTMNKVNNTMIKVFVATAVIIAATIGVTVQQINAQALWMQKPVQCMPSADFIAGARANGYEPLVGGLGVGTMSDMTTTFDVAVVYWTQPGTDNWFISESDQAGTTCMLGNGNNNNFDTDQINSVLDKMADK